MFRRLQLLLATLALASAACASSPKGARTTGNAQLITQQELVAGTEQNLYDYVAAHRPRWLTPRTSGTLPNRSAATAGAAVTVYVDDSRMGGVEFLRSLSRDGARSLRFYDVTEAQQKFPNLETGAVIQVLTR